MCQYPEEPLEQKARGDHQDVSWLEYIVQGHTKGLRRLVQDKGRRMPQIQLSTTGGVVELMAPYREAVGRRKGLQTACLGQRLQDRGIALQPILPRVSDAAEHLVHTRWRHVERIPPASRRVGAPSPRNSLCRSSRRAGGASGVELAGAWGGTARIRRATNQAFAVRPPAWAISVKGVVSGCHG